MVTTDNLLIDQLCPRFDFTRLEHQLVEAPAAVAMEAMRSLDLMTVHSPLTDLAFGVRSLPARLGGNVPPASPSMRIADLFDNPAQPGAAADWVGAAEHRGSQMVFGAVGKFWQPEIEWQTVTREEFGEFADPGWGKIAASVVSHAYGPNRSILTYEARTVLFDDQSRRRFSRYWTLVSPFAGMIMRAALDTAATTVNT